MSNQQQADMKLAYQAAAEMTYIVAVGLSKVMEKQKKRPLISKRQKRVKSKSESSIVGSSI
ncbi:MAG: hypothetical protein KME49_25850 [Brasilonema octagenarum HA4186-MV1]|jgi:hypothetical protein|uniref:Uncharacterized protein n=2 Tax=Brasilonema TaxID=383614 RepID=A0A856MDU8_9CYAN|nr:MULTISPECIES: hypothetical protein [Brasilonema]MBP5977271.1 hypothetical protein [Brasilonema sp. CT11]MBW4628842.1 hypothetical protein [Brasilonema octagenarum HA4186-MV1]QDL15841.1 hypothetical protein DP113_17625 [Brasilonema octagenarum UFV-E1]NMF65898.1 hypothetical protein [Brasilonema octagenarum UFV-OR1]QDL09485.1 hypothetical protein DP114_17690 [Brasilonema sennae CENA114]